MEYENEYSEIAARSRTESWIERLEKEQGFYDPITIDQIRRVVCQFYGRSPEDIFSKSRLRENVEPRQITQKLCSMATPMSLIQIGIQTGNKDHSTVIAAARAVDNLYETDRKFRSQINDILKLLDIKEYIFYHPNNKKP